MKKAVTRISLLTIIAGVIIIIANVIIIIVSLINKWPPTHSVIGGADGPTVIFLAANLGSGIFLTGTVAGIILLIIGIILFLLFREKENG